MRDFKDLGDMKEPVRFFQGVAAAIFGSVCAVLIIWLMML